MARTLVLPRSAAPPRAKARRGRRRGFRRVPAALRAATAAVLLLGVVAAANWAYQVYRKPAELLALVSVAAPRSPAATWTAHGASFRSHATEILTPHLLAALVQVESGGDALARPGWRWRWSGNPFAVYTPASTALGLLQLTDAAFAEARRLCIRDHRVVRAGAWHDPGACWFTGLYTRLLPSHAVEMTAAWLHDQVERVAREAGAGAATLAQKQRLAAVVHLCGASRGAAYARRGFRAAPGERCGSHPLAEYVSRVGALARAFVQLDRPR